MMPLYPNRHHVIRPPQKLNLVEKSIVQEHARTLTYFMDTFSFFSDDHNLQDMHPSTRASEGKAPARPSFSATAAPFVSKATLLTTPSAIDCPAPVFSTHAFLHRVAELAAWISQYAEFKINSTQQMKVAWAFGRAIYEDRYIWFTAVNLVFADPLAKHRVFPLVRVPTPTIPFSNPAYAFWNGPSDTAPSINTSARLHDPSWLPPLQLPRPRLHDWRIDAVGAKLVPS
jgi:hypothetical protein